MRTCFFSASAGILSGALICFLTGAEHPFPVIAGALAPLLWALSLCFPPLRKKSVSLPILFFALGLGLMAVYSSLFTQRHASAAEKYDGFEGRVELVLTDFPDPDGSLTARIREDGQLLPFRLSLADHSGLEAELTPGSELSALVSLRAPRNTLRFSSLTYFRAERVFLTGYVTEALLLSSGELTPQNSHLHLRQSALELCSRLYGHRDYIMRALLFGDKSGFPPDFTAAASSAGVSHFFAVSGMHLSFCVSAALMLGKRRGHYVAAMAAVAVFMAVTGFEPSVVRAGIMQLSVLLSHLLKRESSGFGAMSLSLTVLLLANPCSVGDVGLQFSYCAVLGILLAGPRLKGVCALPAKRLPPLPGKLLCALWEPVSVSLSAMLFTLPLAVLYFEKLSLVSLVTNVALSWLISAVFILGLAALLLSALWLPLGWLPAAVSSLGLDAARSVIFFFGDLPFGVLGTDGLLTRTAVCASYGFGALCFGLRFRKAPLWTAVFFIVSAAAGLLGESALLSPGLRVVTVDSGRGQCALISGGGFHVGLDCDGEGILDAMESRNVRKLDLLILSEALPQEDSFADELILSGRVERLALCEASGDRADNYYFRRIAAENGVPTELLTCDGVISLGDMSLYLALPLSDSEGRGTVSLAVGMGDAGVFIPGSAPPESQRHILSTRDLPPFQVTVISGGGSVGSYCPELVTQGCELAVICGNRRKNAPTEELLELLSENGTEALFTADRGDTEVLFLNGELYYR